MTSPARQTRAEVAREYRIHPRTLHRLEKDYGIPVLRPGRAVIYDAIAIAALEEACRLKSEPARAVKVSGSPAPLRPQARQKGSEYAAELAAMTAERQLKRPPRLPRKSSAMPTMGRVVALGRG